jgi:lactoylglutathione lyase
MKFLHTMIRVTNLEESIDFFCNKLGMFESRRMDFEEGKFSLIFLKANKEDEAELELTYNWDSNEVYEGGRNFGHIALEVDDIYEKCQFLMDNGVDILRPPRDGWMAFIKSPDGISIELLQKGDKLAPQEPWKSMENQGSW